MTFSQMQDELNFDETIYKIKLSKIISLLNTCGPNYITATIDFLENDAASLVDTIHGLKEEIDILKTSHDLEISDLEVEIDELRDQVDNLVEENEELNSRIWTQD